jgi:predicted choloylglycine hydrolase
VAKPKERNRQWEKEHRTHSYRGVPPEIHNQVVALASHLQVTTDEIVQAFVQYGLSCLEDGILTISPRPKVGRTGWLERR